MLKLMVNTSKNHLKIIYILKCIYSTHTCIHMYVHTYTQFTHTLYLKEQKDNESNLHFLVSVGY